MAAVWAMAASAVFGLAASVAATFRRGTRTPLIAGVASLGFTMFAGSWWSYRLLVEHDGSLKSFNWFAASRAVGGTINDFPFFSLLVGDLHAHVIAVPFTVLACWFVFHRVRVASPGRWATTALGGAAALTVGALWSMNAWSVPVVVALLAATVVWSPQQRSARSLARGLLWLLWIGAGALVLYLPFHLDYRAHTSVGVVDPRVSLATFGRNTVLVYGGLLAVTLVPAVLLLRRSTERFVLLLVLAGLGCIVVPEVVFVRDIWANTSLFRMNTVFKIGYETWILLGVASGPLLVSMRPVVRGRARVIAVAALVTVVTVGLSFPVVGTYARTGGFRDPPSLDMLEDLDASAPGDRAAVAWIRKHTPVDAIVLEAATADYTFASTRISTLSGRATVIGWSDHQRVWGNDPGGRVRHVAEIYDTPDANRALALLRRYQVDYVVVGPLERGAHGAAGLTKFPRIASVVFAQQGTAVYQLGD